MRHSLRFSKWPLLILTIFLLNSPAFSQQNKDHHASIKKMTFADSIIIALKNNLDLRSAYLDRIVQKFNLKVAEYKFQPQSSVRLSSKINSTYNEGAGTNGDRRTTGANHGGTFTASLTVPTGGAFNFTWDNKADQIDFSENYTYNPSWNLNFIQPLLKGGGKEVATASLKIAQINEEQNVLALKNIIISIINTTTQAYRSYVQAQRQLEISKQSLAMAKKLYEINKALIEAGRMAEVEIVQTEADIANRELEIIQAQNAVESARLALIQILNIDRDTLFEAVEEKETKVTPPPFAEAMTISLNNRPDYLQVLRDIEVSKLNFVVAKRDQLWDLSLETGVGRSVTGSNYGPALESTGYLDKTNWFIGAILTIPIRDLTIQQAYVNAKVGLDKANLNLKRLEINIGIEVKNALRDVEIKYKQVELARQAVALAEKKLEIENEKLRVGRSTNFQLLSFQNDLVSAQVSELSAVINYLNSLTALDQTLGTTLATWKIEVKKEDEEIRLPGQNKVISR